MLYFTPGINNQRIPTFSRGNGNIHKRKGVFALTEHHDLEQLAKLCKKKVPRKIAF